jgi:hypothetical protein
LSGTRRSGVELPTTLDLSAEAGGLHGCSGFVQVTKTNLHY